MKLQQQHNAPTSQGPQTREDQSNSTRDSLSRPLEYILEGVKFEAMECLLILNTSMWWSAGDYKNICWTANICIVIPFSSPQSLQVWLVL